jgi:tRNA dimethylallyltransferase
MSLSEKYNLVVVLGPTATGKTRFASLLASKIKAEIISADSRQVYRNMNLGTGKDYEDYLVNGVVIPYHLIDIHDPGYKYNVYEFQSDFFKTFEEINNRNKKVILCGGTGMYIDSITKAYKLISVPVNQELQDSLKSKTLTELGEILASYKRLHNRSDSDTIKRAIRAIEIEAYYNAHDIKKEKLPEINPVFIGILFDRDIRRQRITDRLKIRLRNGMIEEVESLLKNGANATDLIYYGLEYKFITHYLQGLLNFDEMEQKLTSAIHQFAKRQMTWFRKMEREGVKINWIDGLLPENDKIETALKIIAD